MKLGAEIHRSKPRALFVQATNPGAYPPLIHASMLMADAGWAVTFLSAPICGDALALAPHARGKVRAIRPRISHVVSQLDYAACTAAATRVGLRRRPTGVDA